MAAGAAFGLRQTADHLKLAIEGEEYEVRTMYPTFVKAARDEGEDVLAGAKGSAYSSRTWRERVAANLLAFSVIPPGVDPATFLVLGSVSMLLMGAAKSGFGGSVGMLSVPLMVYACGGNAPLATGITLPMLVACDYVSVVFWWRKWDTRNVLMLVPGMVLGIAVGTVALWMILGISNGPAAAAGSDLGAGMSALAARTARSSAALNLGIGVVALGFVVLQIVRWIRRDLRPFRPVAWHALIAGSSAGFVSTLAHTAGPITNMYLLPQQMDKGRFVATTVLYYWIGNQVKLVPYFGLGLLTAPTMSADLSLLPAVVIGAMLGIFLHNRVNEKLFLVIVYVLLGGIGLHMAITAAAALLR